MNATIRRFLKNRRWVKEVFRGALKCGGCMNSIRSALLHEPGVTDVTIDEHKETVIVQGGDDLKRENMTALLGHLGYPEKGKNNILQQAKSYISCAIGRLKE